MRGDVPGVVVMSIGSRHAECQSAKIVTESVTQMNIVVVAAAGNSKADACMFHPASARGAITVGAFELHRGEDNAWAKTNFGYCVDIFAPGKHESGIEILSRLRAFFLFCKRVGLEGCILEN